MADKARTTRLKAGLDKREREYLKKISDLLSSSQVNADSVGAVLPEAIQSRPRQDKQLAKSMVVTVENAIDQSIRQDSAIMSDVLFPIIGTAIRKAIRQFMQNTVSRVNGGLQSALSIRRLGWRIQSWRTKTPYIEIVLRHTLQARVEQVFLIHRNTSLLLNSVLTSQSLVQDEDMATSMLTVIRDFARDSVDIDGDDSLESFKVGDYTVIMVDGRHAIVAAIVWGEPGQHIRDQLTDCLESIEVTFRDELEGFTGETAPLQETTPLLNACLVGESPAHGRKSSLAAAVVGVGILLALGYLATTGITYAVRLSQFTDELRATPGLVITEIDPGWRRATVSGLRDPLGPDPQSLLLDHHLDPERTSLRFETYFSSDPTLVIRRAAELIDAPSETGITLDDGTLRVPTWLVSSSGQSVLRLIPGVTDVVLHTEVPDDLAIKLDDLAELVILFEGGSSELLGTEAEDVRSVIAHAMEIHERAAQMGIPVRFRVLGRAAGATNDAEAVAVSQSRADAVAELLVERGVASSVVLAEGAGISAAIGKGPTEDSELNRSASVVAELW